MSPEQPNHPIATRTLGGWRRLGVEQLTQELNSPVQGTGADLLKEAMARLCQTRRQAPSSLQALVGTVHDELVVEVAERHLELATAWLKRCLLEAGETFPSPGPGRGQDGQDLDGVRSGPQKEGGCNCCRLSSRKRLLIG
jgi:hypothetical protein